MDEPNKQAKAKPVPAARLFRRNGTELFGRMERKTPKIRQDGSDAAPEKCKRKVDRSLASCTYTDYIASPPGYRPPAPPIDGITPGCCIPPRPGPPPLPRPRVAPGIAKSGFCALASRITSSCLGGLRGP
jgi:hypothetical protein